MLDVTEFGINLKTSLQVLTQASMGGLFLVIPSGLHLRQQMSALHVLLSFYYFIKTPQGSLINKGHLKNKGTV